ncbi:hypothetical protein [Fimbriiglobus ruber]|uniref:hypothetical protein n=1 Tax=Fimbriiglobus ruber TaxID=1908690 RepID=UPI00117B64AC|nr:hypothetical protein [Fimbriiglobus ruber]
MDRAIDVLLLYTETNQDEMLALLEGCGLTPPEAWRASQFLPIAFAHVVFRRTGVRFQPGYDLLDPDTGEKGSFLLADEPLYVAAVTSAERRLATGCTAQQLFPVFGRSAEYGVIQKIAGPGGQLDGVVLTEPLLMSFGDNEADQP